MKGSRRSVIAGAITSVLAGIYTLTAEPTIPVWDRTVAYTDGDRVRHDGYVWEAHGETSGTEPADTVAIWSRVRPLEGTVGYPQWKPEGIYREGNRVTHDGAVWEAQWWTEGDEPSKEAGPWRKLRERDTNELAPPVQRHGPLQVIDTDLCDEDGEPIQLRGMSSHGIQWYGWGDCLTPDSLDVLATDWQADCCRIAMYVQEGGYATDPEGFTAEVNRIVEALTARGLYAIIDFHVLDPGNPMANLENARRFFDTVAAEHAEKDNIIFEICNEPNGVDWATIKTYAEEILPVIRAHDEQSPVVVGTRGWSSLGLADIGAAGPQEVIDNPVEGENILYAFHFYAASNRQWERNQLKSAAKQLPIFVTEYGSVKSDGGSGSSLDSTYAFLDVMARHNISWTFWNYSDDWRTSGVWQEGTADEGNWTVENLTPTGEWIRSRLRDT